MPITIPPEKKLEMLQDIMAGQDSRLGMAEKHKVNASTIDRLRYMYRDRKPGVTLRQLAGLDKTDAGSPAPVSTTTPTGRQPHSKYDKQLKKWVAMNAAGFSYRTISEKYKVPLSAVTQHLGKWRKLQQALPAVNPVEKGASQNGHVNKYTVIGIAFAETERLIRNFSERFAVPATVVRQGLSELLGRAEVRRARGDDDQVSNV